ncbi:MAG: carbohydrate ABC transporter permease [Lachnospiraceae bacterium]
MIVLNILLGMIWLMPIYWAVVTSIKTQKELYGGISLIPRVATSENYVSLFRYKDGIFFFYLKNSFQICILTMAVVTIVSVLAGFAFSKLKIWGAKIWMSMILFTIMVPAQALMVPLYNTLSDLNLLGTVWGMVLIYVTFQTPFCVLMMKSSFDMVPNALREAALMDGAGSLAIFWNIYCPLTIPGAITVIVYAAYNTWNDYTISLTFGGSSMKTFNVGLVDMLSADTTVNWGTLTSGAIVGMLPILILFLLLQKHFVKGMMSGAVK